MAAITSSGIIVIDGFHMIVTIAEIEPRNISTIVVARCDHSDRICNPEACFSKVLRTFQARKAS